MESEVVALMWTRVRQCHVVEVVFWLCQMKSRDAILHRKVPAKRVLKQSCHTTHPSSSI